MSLPLKSYTKNMSFSRFFHSLHTRTSPISSCTSDYRNTFWMRFGYFE